jgi:enoyl-[acyl-carrier protein] reductase/trans-2-enoyl-CoA reductase (NAD+)
MVIQPKVRGFLCTTTHPTGCFENVRRQAEHVRNKGVIAEGPKRVLVLGASTGYGLASRITAAFGSGASTVGVFFEKPGTDRKPGTAGWYNSAGFHQLADEAGLYAKSLNGDAFSDEMKTRVIDLIKADLGQVDLVVYSLAAPRRTHPETGEVFTSTLKPIGQATTQKGVNTDKEAIQDFHLEPATQQEIDHTVAVMGGEDWQMWITELAEAGVLGRGCQDNRLHLYRREDHLGYLLAWHDWCGEKRPRSSRRRHSRDTGITGWRCACVSIEGGGDAGVSCYSRDANIPRDSVQGYEGEGGSRGLHRADRPIVP